MSQILLSDPSQATTRRRLVTYLVQGVWFHSRDNIVRFMNALKLETSLPTSLVEPASHLLDLSESDYGTMLKISLAHWIEKAKDVATLTNLSDILRTAGFSDTADALGKLQGIDGTIRTPENGVELQECLESCEPGDTIILKSNTEYDGDFSLNRNLVTLRGAEGSNIVNKLQNHWGLWLSGDDCTVDNIRCTGSDLGMCVRGSRCYISGLQLKRLTVLGNDNYFHNAVISDTASSISVQVEGERNYFESVSTHHGSRGIDVEPSATKCAFQNCSFDGATSIIQGGGGRFVDVNFFHGVTVDADDIILERCSGILLELTTKAKLQQKECTFSNVRTKQE